MTNRKNQLLVRLASAYEYRDTPFRLSSGQESNHYLDCRAALSDPETLRLAADAILDAIELDVTAVGGLTMGADPLAIATSLRSIPQEVPLGWFSVRKEPKTHGTGKLIEGHCKPGEKVAVLEDVSTTGASARRAVEACRAAGLNVAQVVTFVDRGGAGALNVQGVAPEVKVVLPFEEVFTVGRARQIAIKAHGNQRYGKDPDSPLYSASHLPAVVDVLAEMLPVHATFLLAAAWLHDCLEDTQETLDSLRAQDVSSIVRDIVDACTDGAGANRKERKQRPYQLIPRTVNSVLIKLADRIANAEAARQEGKEGLVGMYRKEQPEFHERLKNAPVSPSLDTKPFWERLTRALV